MITGVSLREKLAVLNELNTTLDHFNTMRSLNRGDISYEFRDTEKEIQTAIEQVAKSLAFHEEPSRRQAVAPRVIRDIPDPNLEIE